MKKLIITVAATLFLTFAADAQRRYDGDRRMYDRPRHEQRGNVYLELDLTKKQQKALNNLHRENMRQRRSIQSDNSLSREEKIDALRELQKRYQERQEAILTPGQRAQYREKLEEINNRHDYFDQGNWQSLNNVQREQIREINETYKAKADEIENNKFISKDAKQAQLKELQLQKRKAMENVLTPEQRENTPRPKRIRNHQYIPEM